MKQKKKEQRSNKWAFLIYQESVPEDYLNLLEELHVPFILPLGMIKMLTGRPAGSKSHTNMVYFSSNHLKAIHKFQNSSVIS
ncbi:Rep family protein [Lactococcus cremoris]|uniref:Rep family protein n=1 Tax=Lactococcus lactis subsp. cremoris TaxID=1359 RepID=UPI0039F182D9